MKLMTYCELFQNHYQKKIRKIAALGFKTNTQQQNTIFVPFTQDP